MVILFCQLRKLDTAHCVIERVRPASRDLILLTETHFGSAFIGAVQSGHFGTFGWLGFYAA